MRRNRTNCNILASLLDKDYVNLPKYIHRCDCSDCTLPILDKPSVTDQIMAFLIAGSLGESGTSHPGSSGAIDRQSRQPANAWILSVL